MAEQPTIFLAFVAGLISFFAPCVVVLVPVFLANLAGVSVTTIQSDEEAQFRRRVLISTLWFVSGFTVAFTGLGALAGLFGREIVAAQDTLNLIGGALIIIFGLIVAGVIRIPALQKQLRIQVSGNAQGYTAIQSFLVGLTFAIGWTPCVGPVLASILILGASTATVGSSALLLFAYALGLMLPFLVFAALLQRAFGWVRSLGPHLHTIEIIAGILLVLMGILVATGNLSQLIGTLYFLAPPTM